MSIYKTFLSVLISSLILLSCGGKSESPSSDQSSTPKKETKASSEPVADAKPASSNRKGKLVYKQYCVICHGADGKLAVSDAKDLSESIVSMEERIDQITNGKGLMTPYKDILSKEQISAVAEYLEELRK